MVGSEWEEASQMPRLMLVLRHRYSQTTALVEGYSRTVQYVDQSKIE